MFKYRELHVARSTLVHSRIEMMFRHPEHVLLVFKIYFKSKI
jgi:hypothetical protein